MRSKYLAGSLVVILLISSWFLAVGPFAPVSAAGGTNLTLGKNVTSSGQSQTYSPDHIKDSNQETYWESTNNTFPQWISVDLGASTSMDQIVLKVPAGWETRTQTLAIQGSTNGITFTDIVGSKEYVFNPAVAGNSVTIHFTAVSTRYVRLNVTANTGWPAAQLSEFEIYGTGSITPTPAPTATPTPTPTASPTVTPAPTVNPTATPTTSPAATLPPANQSAHPQVLNRSWLLMQTIIIQAHTGKAAAIQVH